MNTNIFDFNENTRAALSSIETDKTIPHAVIIESSDGEEAVNAAKLLSMYAVCRAKDKPCGCCGQCRKAQNAAHPDITYIRLIDKAKFYKIDQIRELIKDTVIVPNDAEAKVYIFEKADLRLDVVQQNALLKVIEEPPKNVYFIFLCENSRRLLVTIRSRCIILRISNSRGIDGEILENAREIIRGILSPMEYSLLKALNVLTDKNSADETLTAASLILRDGLVCSAGGSAKADAELARQLSLKFTKDKLIKMIELTENQKKLISQNANINLLTTRLCGEYRRISWQR